MAPPKRKSGGRVTPKGTRPGDRPADTSTTTTSGHDKDAASTKTKKVTKRSSGGSGSGSKGVAESSRYTRPVPTVVKESPPWVPVLMLALLVAGGLVIMMRYLVIESNPLVFVGLALILAGLYTATKWR